MPASVISPSRADLRTGGRWTARQWLKNTVIYWLIVVTLVLVDRTPERVLLWLGRSGGGLCYWLCISARRIAKANLSALLPDADALVRAVFGEAGLNLARTLLLRRDDFDVAERVYVSPETQALLSRRASGAVFVSAHIGPYEWIAALLAAMGLSPAVVVRESYDPRLNAVVDSHRVRRGVLVLHRGQPTSATKAMRLLRSGHPVGFLPDLGARVPSTEVRFCGQLVAMPIGPQQLAQRLHRPLLFGCLRPNRGKKRPFELVVTEIPTDPSLQRLTQRLTDAISSAVMRSPEQWLWMAPRFSRLREHRAER